jgi:hypothetical protein
MTKKAEEVLYDNDGLQIIIKADPKDVRKWIYKTMIQNLLVVRKIKNEGADND